MLPTLTTDDLTNAERELCRRSLAAFVRRAWRQIEPGQPYVHGWHVDAICEHLEAITSGDITRLLINIPPGTMKSTLCSVFWPAWEWGPKELPSTRIINAAHEQGLAIRDTLKMRRLIQSPWYQRLWPTGLTSDQNQKTYYENSATGFRQACAVASMTGRRGDRVIWDDPHSIESAHSDTGRDTAIRVFTETLPTRLSNPDRSAIVVVMQRIHEADVSGYILANDLGYDHLCLPMEYEPTSRVTSIGFRDPRTESGELLFPGRFSRETVDRDKKIMGDFAVAGQFQQRPSPLGGGMFKDDWWRFYKVAPAIKWRAIYADTAQKTKQANDYSVFQLWGESTSGQALLLDQIRGKWEAPELLTQARAFWNKHRVAGVRSFNIEDKVSGTGLIQTLKREGVPVVAIQRNTDKITRAMDAAPFIQSGNVLLPEDAPWLSDYLAEFSQFPNGVNDDQCDPTMDAVKDILQGGSYSLSAWG
jgi:predicted phage terminase large subunit-like protein